MGMRAVSIFMFILCLSASSYWMNHSGMNDHMGVSKDTGLQDDIEEVDQSDEGFSSNVPDVADYLGYAVTAVKSFVNIFIVLGPIETAFKNVGFPGWLVFPVMNLVLRPIYTLAGVQMIRGVMVE
ncbi:hypothetical protein [Haloarchaeobius sp. DFWS5]|uniref:hypothetical protein n=1 Tax=Haloarchaeobius sp. DFWS5 TaxID=3446114 RepID=UPI003EB6F737